MDLYRLMPSFEDPSKFFNRPLSQVEDSDMWRWLACKLAAQED